MSRLKISNLTKKFGDFTAVDDVSLSVEGPELIALLGPSGCGKTTLLRMVAGFIEATSGSIEINGRDITNTPPHLRNTGMIFQSYALFPHMTVAENVGFGLEMRKVPKAERESLVNDALNLVHLTGLGDRFPRQMSGGQRQRVAIARALVIKPDIFLLDEPLSNLDAVLRQSVGLEIRSIQKKLGLTSLFVTHDQQEALTLADRLVVINHGKIVQVGTGPDLYLKPNSRFVANFLGKSNLLKGSKTSEATFETVHGTQISLDAKTAEQEGDLLCVRPENIEIGPSSSRHANCFNATVTRVTYLGSIGEVEAVLGGGETISIQVQNTGNAPLPVDVDSEVTIGWPDDAGHLLQDDQDDQDDA